MAIRDFGESLLADVRERKDAQARDARKRAKSQERKDVLQNLLFKGAVSIGNSVLANKNEKFLQNENFYARSAKLKTNVAENNNALNSWNTSLAYEGGQDAYYTAQAKAQIEQKFMTDTYKASFSSPEQYASHMQAFSNELGLVMKENAKSNFEKASEMCRRGAQIPKKLLRNLCLKASRRT